MTTIVLSPGDLAIAAALVVLDAGLSLVFKLDLHKQIAVAAARLVVQLVAVGYVLRVVFALNSPAATLAIALLMMLVAAREVAARPSRRLARHGNLVVGASSVALATALTAVLALTTAIRPQPWWDPRYALPLTGIILGNVLNAGSITLDAVLTGFAREQAAIEARLALGDTFKEASRPIVVAAIRLGMVPLVNQMSAAGIVTLPGIMTGQILAGMDPLDAVKYQILLMFLLAGAGGLVAVTIALLAARRVTDARQRLRLDRLG